MLPESDEVGHGDPRGASGEVGLRKLQGGAGASRRVAWRRGKRRGGVCVREEGVVEILLVPLAQDRGEVGGARRGIPGPRAAGI